jgi:hypothetical protein
MNEIIGPIYYVFASDSRTEWQGDDFNTVLNPYPHYSPSKACVDCLFNQRRLNDLQLFAIVYFGRPDGSGFVAFGPPWFVEVTISVRILPY